MVDRATTTANKRLGARLLLGAILILTLADAHAGKVVLQIRAGNPLNAPQKVPIKSTLPLGVTPKDVLDSHGLEIGYDVKNDIYYVHKEVQLGPKETVTYDVEINDVWVVPPEELAVLRARSAQLVDKLGGYKEYHDAASALNDDIGKNLSLIGTYQEQNSLKAGVRPIEHIKAYEANRKVLSKVKRDVGRIENLVLGTGQDPGQLLGETREIGRPKGEVESPPGQYRTVIYRITVQNTSPTATRKLPVKRDLPAEIKSYDVLDAGELEIGTDSRSGTCFVFKNDVTIGPNQTITYDVKIRDKWNVNRPRMEQLLTSAKDISARLSVRPQFKSVEETMRGLIADLENLLKEKGPEELNDQYVAYYRGQAERLDAIEQKIFRIDTVLKPIEKTTKIGFKVRAPSAKTTWMIIYIILGFLLVMSLLFFFRWYGRSKAETLVERQRAGAPPTGESQHGGHA